MEKEGDVVTGGGEKGLYVGSLRRQRMRFRKEEGYRFIQIHKRPDIPGKPPSLFLSHIRVSLVVEVPSLAFASGRVTVTVKIPPVAG